MSTTNESNPSELERAWQRFERAASVHTAAIQALRLMQTIPDADQHLAASLLVRLKADPRYTEKARLDAAEQWLQVIEEEAGRDFSVLRESALANVCGGFEYLLKAFFVHGEMQDEAAASAKIASLRVRVNAADVLGLPRSEVWFAVADHVLEAVGQGVPMSTRVQKFLVEHTNVPPGLFDTTDLEKAFDTLDSKTFNEAYLVRNCIVHNGGRFSTALARLTGRPAGTQIEFAQGYVAKLIKPIKGIADQLSPLWLIHP